LTGGFSPYESASERDGVFGADFLAAVTTDAFRGRDRDLPIFQGDGSGRADLLALQADLAPIFFNMGEWKEEATQRGSE